MDFAKENPGVVVYVKPRRHRIPVLVGEYREFQYERLLWRPVGQNGLWAFF